MAIILLTFLALVLGALLFAAMSADSGYVLISFASYTLEMSFWFAIFVCVVGFFALRFISRVIKKWFATLGWGVSWFASARARRAELKTRSGLIHFMEGNWLAAKRDLLTAARGSDAPLVQLLAAARSAHELGYNDETQQLLSEAEKIAPENELAIALSQARMQLMDKKYELCLATLKRAKQKSPGHPVILDLLKQVYWHLKDWQALIILVPELRACHQYSDEEQAFLEENVYMAFLNAEIHKLDADAGEKHLDGIWKSLPKSIRQKPKVIALYARLLIKNKLLEKAEALLRQALKRNWDNDLLILYGQLQLQGQAVREQLIVAQNWLRERPGDAHLLLALGRISVRNELWGQAKEYFENSLSIKDMPDTYAELAALQAHLGNHRESTELYQKGLEIFTHSQTI